MSKAVPSLFVPRFACPIERAFFFCSKCCRTCFVSNSLLRRNSVAPISTTYFSLVRKSPMYLPPRFSSPSSLWSLAVKMWPVGETVISREFLLVLVVPGRFLLDPLGRLVGDRLRRL